jgi:hypothetical protein
VSEDGPRTQPPVSLAAPSTDVITTEVTGISGPTERPMSRRREPTRRQRIVNACPSTLIVAAHVDVPACSAGWGPLSGHWGSARSVMLYHASADLRIII